SISNLGLIDVDVTGDQRTGGLVGYSNGTNISNCYCSGTVIGDLRTGGLVGSSINGTIISDCYCSGTVTGNGYTGGFVGQSYNGPTISRSYSTGTVTSNGSYTGGFVGHNYNDTGHTSTISNCYSRSTVNGNNNSDTGGLVGRNYGMISKCYSTGSVSGGSDTGGLVGDNSGGTEDSFWDTVTSNQNSSDGGTGKTTDEMTTDAHSLPNFYTDASWDFRGEVTNGTDDTWNIGNNKNDGYPYLDWQYPDDPPLPVTLSSFTVTLQNSIPLLQWTTQSENDNLGWNVYRSTSQNLDQAYQINSEMISGGGNSTEPRDYLFEDEYDPQPGMTYWYWLESVSFSGDSDFYNPISIYILEDSEDPDLPPVPQYFGLYQNYPNPFNPTTIISFALEEAGNCELTIYDIKGREVKTLFKGEIEANLIYNIIWDGKDDNNEDVASGIYYYSIKTGKIQQIRKMILAK
ncbi:MAG: T9SS type A sorting domain-containing protein, partial [Candidatus Cloacimonetes bacterium]|nr:T9SS type A sorting domain-containing protein [Candidatus Cloacimonadota bacterium]